MEGIRILFEDNHLIVVEKPANVPSVPDRSGDLSAFHWVKHYIKESKNKPGNVYLGTFHRLDRPVSGVLAFARTSKAAKRMTEAIKSSKVKKLYLAVTEGRPRKEAGEERIWIEKNRAKNLVRTTNRGQGKMAITRWRTLEFLNGSSALLLLEPVTGRPHQIRLTLSYMGCPIKGDIKYGARKALPDRSIALHAVCLSFPHPTKVENVDVWSFPTRPPFPKVSRKEVGLKWKN